MRPATSLKQAQPRSPRIEVLSRMVLVSASPCTDERWGLTHRTLYSALLLRSINIIPPTSATVTLCGRAGAGPTPQAPPVTTLTASPHSTLETSYSLHPCPPCYGPVYYTPLLPGTTSAACVRRSRLPPQVCGDLGQRSASFACILRVDWCPGSPTSKLSHSSERAR